MHLVPCVLLAFAVGALADKEVIDSDTENAASILTDKLWLQLVKRLKDYGYSNTDVDPLGRELNDEQCTYAFRNGTIIRTHDSIEAGATFINSQIGISKEDCTAECCSATNCNVAVFKEKDNDHSCYLFDCGTPNICKFTNHPGYTVIELPSRTTTNKVLEKHEDDLEQLAEMPTTPTTSTTPKTTTVITTTQAKVAPKERKPVSLFGKCEEHKDCAGSWSQCLGGYCVCKDGYHEQEGTCRKDCSKFEFECRNTGQPLVYPQCVAIYNKCDGIPLCKDGSDEADCGSNEDRYSQQYSQQPGVGSVQQPSAISPPVQNVQLAVNPQLAPAQQVVPQQQQLANLPYQAVQENTGQTYGDVSQQYAHLGGQLQNLNNQVPLQSQQYQIPDQQAGTGPVWGQQQQQQVTMQEVYNKPQPASVVQAQQEWSAQSQAAMQPAYNMVPLQQQNYSQLQQQPEYAAPAQLPQQQQQMQVGSHAEKTQKYQTPFEAQPQPEQPRNRGRLLGVTDRENGAINAKTTGRDKQESNRQSLGHGSAGINTNRLRTNATHQAVPPNRLSQENIRRPPEGRQKTKQNIPFQGSNPQLLLPTEKPAINPDSYYKKPNPPYDSNSRHGLYGGYNRDRSQYNGGYLNNINSYMPENEGYGQNDGYDLGINSLYGSNLAKNRPSTGGRGQYIDYDQYFGDAVLNGLDPNLAYDYYPVDTGKKANHLKQKQLETSKGSHLDADDDYSMVTKQDIPVPPKISDSSEAELDDSINQEPKKSGQIVSSRNDDHSTTKNTKEKDQTDPSAETKKQGGSHDDKRYENKLATEGHSESSKNPVDDASNDSVVAKQEPKVSDNIQSLGSVVQVVLAEDGNSNLDKAVDNTNVLRGFYHSSKGAVVALSLGLCITAMLLIFIGCRLRNVKKRLRRGRPLNSNEADYLINGMYL